MICRSFSFPWGMITEDYRTLCSSIWKLTSIIMWIRVNADTWLLCWLLRVTEVCEWMKWITAYWLMTGRCRMWSVASQHEKWQTMKKAVAVPESHDFARACNMPIFYCSAETRGLLIGFGQRLSQICIFDISSTGFLIPWKRWWVG